MGTLKSFGDHLDPQTLPLARTYLNRNSEARSAPGFIEDVLANERTVVLVMKAATAPLRGFFVSASTPAGQKSEQMTPEGSQPHLELIPLCALRDVLEEQEDAQEGEPRGIAAADPLYLGEIYCRENHENRENRERGDEGGTGKPDNSAEATDTNADTTRPATRPVLLVRAERLSALPTILDSPEISWHSLRDCATELEDQDAGLLVEATAALNWLVNFGFCPACGASAPLSNAGWTRVCSVEGRELYPRTDPAIIVAVIDEQDRILLGNSANWKPGHFSTLAGFVEPGESSEAAVIREVAEESGVCVVEPWYVGSQPWPFPASLMLGYLARATSTELHPDGLEIRELRWFTREQLAQALRSQEISIAGRTSIARALIEHWYGGPLEENK